MAKPDKKSTSTDKTNTLEVAGLSGNQEKIVAQVALRPSVQAAMTLQHWSKRFGELDLSHLVEELRTQATFSNDGKLARGEAMLMTQAHTLDAIFNELARRAALNMGRILECM